MQGTDWHVVDYVSVQGVLVVNIETARSHDVIGIAQEVVPPLMERYIEVLVYFRRPGKTLADARVQWTPTGGYRDLVIAVDRGLHP